MEISPNTLALITSGSMLLGVIVTSLFNLLTTRINKKSEERKHQRETIINAAIANWKHQLELAKAGSQHQSIRPLDDYITHMVAVSQILLEKPINKATVMERLNELEELSGMIDAHRNSRIRQIADS